MFKKKILAIGVIIASVLFFLLVLKSMGLLEESVVLTNRQKNILMEQGLPTDYDELSFSKQVEIEAIENMLKYLEKKYKSKFEYKDYTPNGAFNEERLEAISADRKDLGIICVTREAKNGKWVYEDDYDELLMAEKYKKELFKFLDKQIPGKEAKCVIYTDISKYDSKKKDIVASSSAQNRIGIKGISVERFKYLIKKYDNWMSEKELQYSTSTFFVLLKEKEFNNVSDSVISDYIHDNKYVKCVEWYYDLDEKTIEEWK